MCFKDVQQRCRMDGFRIDGFKDLWIFGCKYNTIFTLMQVLGGGVIGPAGKLREVAVIDRWQVSWGSGGALGLFPGGGLTAADEAEEAGDDGGVHE